MSDVVADSPIADRQSETWRAVEAWAESRLKDHRLKLETRGLPQIDTEGHRSAIFELKALLNLQKPSKIPPG